MRTGARILIFALIGVYAVVCLVWLVRVHFRTLKEGEYVFVLTPQVPSAGFVLNPKTIPFTPTAHTTPHYQSNQLKISYQRAQMSNEITTPILYLNSRQQMRSIGGGTVLAQAQNSQNTSATPVKELSATIALPSAIMPLYTKNTGGSGDIAVHRANVSGLRRDGFIDDPNPSTPADPLVNENGFIDDPDPNSPADPLVNTPIGAVPILLIGLLIGLYTYKIRNLYGK